MLTVEVTGVDTFGDTCQAPRGPASVVVDLFERHTHLVGVEPGHFLLAKPTGCSGNLGVALFFFDVLGVMPVTEQASQVSHRVTQSAQLPVEHASYRTGRVHHAVGQAVVAVGDRGRCVGRDVRPQVIGHPIDHREFPSLRLFPLARPSFDLAFDVAGAFGQVT